MKLEEMISKVINADCLDIMKQMPDKCIDLVLTDPPYGINVGNMQQGFGGGLAKHNDYGSYTWDKNRISKEVFDEIFRISKNQIIFGGNYYTDYLAPKACWIVWNKKANMPSIDFADCELAWTSFDSPARIMNYLWRGMLQENMGNAKETRQHPTQKPQPLMEWCLQNYSEPNDLILDCFLGSGTTAVAAQKLGRRFIGIEISKDYCTIAENRLKQRVLNFPTTERLTDVPKQSSIKL